MEENAEIAPSNFRGSPDADALYCEECLRVDRSFNDIPNIAPRHDHQRSPVLENPLILSLKADIADIKPDTTCPSCRDFFTILDKVGPDARYFGLMIRVDRSHRPDTRIIWPAAVDTTKNGFIDLNHYSYLLRRSDYPTRLRNDSATHTEAKHLPTRLIKSWLHTCEREHEGCRSNPTDELDMSLYLIDVVDECITLKPALDARYVALSYVWGNVKSTNLTSRNMEDLRKPRSLSSGSHVATVPQTIRDAMRLTADLYVRYLWVDCLCLIQNDPNLSFYLNRMHLIYANAFLTIVVVNKDNANGGITGYDTRSTGRILPGKVINYPNYVLGMVKETQLAAVAALPWCSRAWTLQEGFSSRRVLVIDDRICLKCVDDYLEEGLSFGIKTNSNLSYRMEALLSTLCQASLTKRQPNWHAYSLAATSFAPRALSYDQDSIKAFLGVMNFYTSLNNLQGAVNTQLLYGHPVCKLSRTLSWGSEGSVLKRRMLLRQNGSFVMPSWSWMAWRHCHKNSGDPLGFEWLSAEYDAEGLRVPTVIYAQCGICLQNHQMTSERCSTKASAERINPEYLDPYLYIKAQRGQFGVSCYDRGLKRSLIPFGITQNTEDTIVGEIVFDHSPPQFLRGDSGALDFIGICYTEIRYRSSSNRPAVEALCIIPVNGKPGLFERLGVATILKDAWDQVAQFDEIILG